LVSAFAFFLIRLGEESSRSSKQSFFSPDSPLIFKILRFGLKPRKTPPTLFLMSPLAPCCATPREVHSLHLPSYLGRQLHSATLPPDLKPDRTHSCLLLSRPPPFLSESVVLALWSTLDNTMCSEISFPLPPFLWGKSPVRHVTGLSMLGTHNPFFPLAQSVNESF